MKRVQGILEVVIEHVRKVEVPIVDILVEETSREHTTITTRTRDQRV
jgi:hypothetical protein